MFGNTSNNTNDVSVNTRAVTLYSDLSCLQLGFWNDKLSVKINPIVSIDDDGARKYDFEKRINTAISQEKCASILDDIIENIMPAIRKSEESKEVEEEVSIAYPVGKSCALAIEFKQDVKTMKPAVYLSLYRNIKEDNTCDETYSYKFNTSESVKNYDPKTGTGIELIKQTEFLSFVGILKTMPDVIGAAHHGSTYQEAFSTKRTNNYGNNNNYGGMNRQNTVQQQNTQYSAPVSTTDDEYLPF